MRVGSGSPLPLALGPMGQGPEVLAPCTPLRQAWTPLEWSQGGGGGLQQPGAHPCLPFPHPQGQGGSAGPSGM